MASCSRFATVVFGRGGPAQRTGGRTADDPSAPLPGRWPAVETRATGSALFASGTRSSEVQNPTQGGESAPVVVRHFDAPDDPGQVERSDIDSAQLYRINAMLDEAQVGPGSRVLEMPSSGGALPVLAARRGAHVDVLTSDVEHAATVRERAHDAGVGGAVRVQRR